MLFRDHLLSRCLLLMNCISGSGSNVASVLLGFFDLFVWNHCQISLFNSFFLLNCSVSVFFNLDLLLLFAESYNSNHSSTMKLNQMLSLLLGLLKYILLWIEFIWKYKFFENTLNWIYLKIYQGLLLIFFYFMFFQLWFGNNYNGLQTSFVFSSLKI